MSDKIVLRGCPTGIRSREGKRFVTDSARAAENLLSDADLCRLYQLSFADLEAAVANEAFKKALNAKRVERMQDGTAVKEQAAQHLIEGPKRSDSIMVNGTLQDEIECELKAAGSAKESVSAFRTFIADSLKEERREVVAPADIKSLPVGRLLHWLLNFWDEPTICVRDLCTYGPRPRNWNETINLAETLAQRGWLLPLPSHRHDRKIWLIVRKAEQIGAHRTSNSLQPTAARRSRRLAQLHSPQGFPFAQADFVSKSTPADCQLTDRSYELSAY